MRQWFTLCGMRKPGVWLSLTGPSEVVRREIVGCLEGEVVDQPAVAERAVGDVGDVELAGRLDQPVGLVDGLKGGVFGLDGVYFGDWVLL